MNRIIHLPVYICLLLLGTGCASNLPKEISKAPVPDISVSSVQKDIKANKNKLVRWGGIIINIVNLEKKSTLEVLAKPLNNYGQPALNVTGTGRFFAELNEFLDPSVYAPGREVTVFGTVTGLRTSKIGEHTYHYPVIEVSRHHIWKYSVAQRNYDPYWDDYWYWGYSGPWPWFYWDYYGHRHPRYFRHYH